MRIPIYVKQRALIRNYVINCHMKKSTEMSVASELVDEKKYDVRSIISN